MSTSPKAPTHKNTSNKDEINLSLVPIDKEMAVHVPVNHLDFGNKKTFDWNDLYRQH